MEQEEDGLKKKLLAGVLTIIIFVAVYYSYNQLFMEDINQIEFVNEEDIVNVTIASYPDMDVYSTRDEKFIKEALTALVDLDVKIARNFKESDVYYKVKFTDEKNYHFISYTFYEDGFLMVEEKAGFTGITSSYKIKDPLFEEMFYPLLEAEADS